MGVFLVLYSASAPATMCVISCDTGPHYNSTGLYCMGKVVASTAPWICHCLAACKITVVCTRIPFSINTLRPRQNGRHFADDTFKCIFVNGNVRILIEISLKFVPKGPINNIPALVQIMAWRRPGDKPLSEPMMVCLPTHICVTRPQWVNLQVVCTRIPFSVKTWPPSQKNTLLTNRTRHGIHLVLIQFIFPYEVISNSPYSCHASKSTSLKFHSQLAQLSVLIFYTH